VPEAGCRDASGDLLLIGRVASAQGERSVVARARAGSLTLVEDLPAPASGERVTAMVSDAAGDLLYVTSQGRARYRKGQTWHDAVLEDDLPRRVEAAGDRPATVH
jgi:hypothetical protein